VGVVPQTREYPAGVDLFVPDAFEHPWRSASRNNINFSAIARLADGVTMVQARSEMRAIASRVHAAHPEDLYGHSVAVTPLQDRVVGPVASYLRLLGGAVVVVPLMRANLVARPRAKCAVANCDPHGARSRAVAARQAACRRKRRACGLRRPFGCSPRLGPRAIRRAYERG
jgi:hypothetical protein